METYNPAQKSANHAKEILSTYYGKFNMTDGEFNSLSNKSLADMVGNIVCDLMLFCKRENIAWKDVHDCALCYFLADVEFFDED